MLQPNDRLLRKSGKHLSSLSLSTFPQFLPYYLQAYLLACPHSAPIDSEFCEGGAAEKIELFTVENRIPWLLLSMAAEATQGNTPLVTGS